MNKKWAKTPDRWIFTSEATFATSITKEDHMQTFCLSIGTHRKFASKSFLHAHSLEFENKLMSILIINPGPN